MLTYGDLKLMNSSQAKQIESYNKMASEYCFWGWSAKVLLDSVNILRRERERALRSHKGATFPRVVSPEELTEEVEWMLQAFAIECLLKGLVVKGGGKIAEKGNLVKKCKTHNFEKLIKQVNPVMDKNNISINIDLQQILQKLSSVAILGRYPIARNYSSLTFSEKENVVGYDNPSVLITDDEKSLVDDFTSKLLKILTEEGG